METLTGLLRLLGEDLVLGAATREAGIDRTLIEERLKLTEGERLDYGTAMADQLLEMSPSPRRSE
jgi:hypothetical protein